MQLLQTFTKIKHELVKFCLLAEALMSYLELYFIQ